MPENADELKQDIEVGDKFYVELYILDDAEVVSVEFEKESKDNMYPSDYNSSSSWIFKAVEEDGTEWFIQVLPNASRDGVLRLFWGADDEIEGGHHEVYPNGMKFI
jgi:hypothetical protein